MCYIRVGHRPVDSDIGGAIYLIGLGIRSYIGLGISGKYTGFRPLELVSFGTDFMQIPVL
jgi:hypothetical protein